MKRMLFLTLSLLACMWAHGQIYYQTTAVNKNFDCKADDQGVLCVAPAVDPAHDETVITKPYTTPGSIRLEEEKENFKKFIADKGYTLLQQTEVKCTLPDTEVITFVSTNKKHDLLQGAVRIDKDTVALLLQSRSGNKAKENPPLFTSEVLQEICNINLPLNTIFLFDKQFRCVGIDSALEEVDLFECKLGAQDPQAGHWFIEKSYMAQEPVFKNPKKRLKEILTSKDFACQKHKVFSCPTKDVVVGECQQDNLEVLIRHSEHSLIILSNNDKEHPIASKEKAKEMCGITWGRFVL